MIISESHRFIFIAVPKTGTTSIERALQAYGSTVAVRAADGKHKTALQLRAEVGEKTWNNYFTFAFVRNPLDWTASWYNFRRLEGMADKNHPKHKSYTGNTSFDDFVKSDDWVLAGKGQSHWVTDEHGEVILDFIGRFETLQRDFDVVCRTIGIRPTRLASLNRSKFVEPESLYTNESKAVVESRLGQDMKLFGYSPTYRADRLKGRTWWRYLKDRLRKNLRYVR